MQLTLNRRERDVHDRGVEHDHQLAHAQHDQGDPAPPIHFGDGRNLLCLGGARDGCAGTQGHVGPNADRGLIFRSDSATLT